MPCAASTLAADAQSGQYTQCVRLVVGAWRLGKWAANCASWVSKYVESWACVRTVVGHEAIKGCSATSKPSAVYAAACASVRIVFGRTYDVERRHCHFATTQPGALSCSNRLKWNAVPPGV